MAAETKIVVVGAGVSGLTTALLLAEDHSNKITVIATHQPGDTHIDYASPWAGANYVPVSLSGSIEEAYERNTWQHLEHLAKDVPEAGIHLVGSHEYFPPVNPNSEEAPALRKWRAEIESEKPWFSEVVPDWRELSENECPSPYPRGVSFTSVCMNPQVYLPYLQSACIKAGVTFRRVTISHISEASKYFFRKQNNTLAPHFTTETADVIVNCTGLSSHKLGGVEDKLLYPIRGQIVIVQQEVDYMIACADIGPGTAAPEELCYVMSRAAGGGTVLGGTYQIGNWDDKVNPDTAERIMKRAAKYVPALIHGNLHSKVHEDDWKNFNIVRHCVGLRPARKGGIRLEKEYIESHDWKGWVVHNYGHGGYGYQSSYGCSQQVVKLVGECKPL